MADDRFPELESAKDLSPDGDVSYIGSSEAVGAGHEDSLNRLPDPNTEWDEGEIQPSNNYAVGGTTTSF